MIQNSRIERFAKSFSLSVAVVATSVGWAADASSQIVNSDAFNEPAGHSILEVAKEVSPTETQAARFSSGPLTKINQDDSTFDAPVAPLPRMTSVKPLAPQSGTFGGNSSGTFAGSNPSNELANRRGLAQNEVSQLQPSNGGNSLSGNRLRPAPEDRPEDQPQQLSSSSVGSFGDQPSPRSSQSSGFASSKAVVTNGANSTASIYGQTSGQDQQEDQSEEPRYESAYLHDQRPQRDTPVEDLFSSPANSKRLTPPAKLSAASNVEDDFGANDKNSVQQTAYLSPAAPAQPQFQNGGYSQQNSQQNNQQFGQRPQDQRQQRGQRGQQNQFGQQNAQYQRTQQRNLPRQNQSQGQQRSQTQTADSSAAKEAIAKFSFDANQQLANGLPVRMIDLLQQSEGRASRSQLIPQYWEVYYDWAQSVSAKHHQDWVASINSAKQTDAQTIEVAKSNAQNEITFSAIQLGKSQAKMKSLTGAAQPIVPMDSPTVTRVKTNYDAFKNRGMIAPKFEGIDSTLKQMYELIASRASTVSMAQNNANEAQQSYSRNQSTVDHVLAAGRTWRAAESDFIASVIEYNKAYADYALALPYGRGPVETVVNMLIVKPTNNQNVSSQVANGRPNLSNDARSNNLSQNNTRGNDYSVPYTSNPSNQQNGRTAQTRQANTANRNGANIRRASNSTGPRPDGPGDRGQASARNNLMQNARSQTPPRAATQQQATGFNTAAQQPTQPVNRPSQPASGSATTERSSLGTNYIKRPSQFPTGQPSSANPFSSANGQGQPSQQSNQKSFQGRPSTQPPAGDKTAGRPSPFGAVRSADSSTATPFAKPKPPASAGGFNFGG